MAETTIIHKFPPKKQHNSLAYRIHFFILIEFPCLISSFTSFRCGYCFSDGHNFFKNSPTNNKKKRFLGKIHYLCTHKSIGQWNKKTAITVWTSRRCGSSAGGRARRSFTAGATSWSARATRRSWVAFVERGCFKYIVYNDEDGKDY